MVKQPVAREDNLFALQYFSKHLSQFDPVIFFGSLLGITREGGPIDGDDDVDFYIDRRHFAEVRNHLATLGLQVSSGYPNNTDFFIQVADFIDGHTIRADFYFFDFDPCDQVLVEKWNFAGQVSDPQQALRVPGPLFFPLQAMSLGGTRVYIPSYPKLICEFLYGPNWMEPKRKGLDYNVKVIAGRPIRFASNKLNQIVFLD